MTLRKYRRLLNRSRNGWVWFPWVRMQDLTTGERYAILKDRAMSIGRIERTSYIEEPYVHNILCTNLSK